MQLSFPFVRTQLRVCQRRFSSHTCATFARFFPEACTGEEVFLSIARHPAVWLHITMADSPLSYTLPYTR